MEPRDKHHHRSKSQLAKSLLHKVSSKADVHKEDPGETSESVGRDSLAASESNMSMASRSSRPRPGPSSTSVPDEGNGKAAVQSDPAASGASLEQSVRLFRYFEALQIGDRAAIAKALQEQTAGSSNRLEGTTLLHLAIQCADAPTIEYVLGNTMSSGDVWAINSRDKDGNTPLHLASRFGRAPIVRLILDQDDVDDSITNFQGQTALDLAYSPEIFQQLQLARSFLIDSNVRKIQELIARRDYIGLEQALNESKIKNTIDVNGMELATDKGTVETGGTLLHEAARKKDLKLIQILLMNGADPFRRDRKGKLPQDGTKDEKTRHILKRSPAAETAQRSVQEKGILGNSSTQALSIAPNDNPLGGKESREMKGYLKKWTNYTGGWKLRWFVLEEGVLSYYKNQDDAGAACRGAINMRIARLNMDPQDKLRLEIHGKSSVKYHLKANHQVEAKRWYWALNNAIQWAKDEDKEEQKRQDQESETLKQARAEQDRRHGDSASLQSGRPKSSFQRQTLAPPQQSVGALSTGPDDDDEGDASMFESSIAGPATRFTSRTGADTYNEDEDAGDDTSSHDAQPVHKDALNITAQSLKLQLDLLAQVSSSLTAERSRNPNLSFADPSATAAISAYESAVGNLKGLIGDFLRIANDRDAYWQYRLDREANIRRMWEESMAKVAQEQELLGAKMEQSEDKRKRTKRALRDALETIQTEGSRPITPAVEGTEPPLGGSKAITAMEGPSQLVSPLHRKSTVAEVSQELSDDESADEEEFFDAVDAGEVEVVEMSATVEQETEVPKAVGSLRDNKLTEIQKSFAGYEDGIRKRLAMDADDRPKISLWGILKSMIGKDMTKMTLPVSFNEPTSLLQRVAEDMEYTDLLDSAAEVTDSTERMVYVAAFAASEYASTIGRVAKPFNPLLAETYEYVRPDKNYRFFIEQVSHHPPIGAAYAESPKWDYYGESAVKSKFYGKSFDINPLGTWFLRLRPSTGGEELYTWKKVTSSVIGIISGSPTVDNYGTMEVKNWKTGEVCTLDFKPRGWTAASAYIVGGRVIDAKGKTRWSMGGRWNDKIYARLTPGYEDKGFSDKEMAGARGSRTESMSSSQAFLVWEANKRPTGIPFNLTPFVVTLNALPDKLRPVLAPTDTRLRPDQRAMEDGLYDLAATEKDRVEVKQRARRKIRDQRGEHFTPRWFTQTVCETTGEKFWKFSGEYWAMRDSVAHGGSWKGLEDIFSTDPVEE
ncbi:hypothetical protein BT63DRAFT_405680 [Microthyrium microscopicum]|uniref:PH domain-containing protein n=1 Tax=Microthyrium microscopicum TaxID=703497 RepID=A0A6A6U220_9PEZI|nr:hypothetical protein BT63DRAFT_405680 [Microthyrium microscopicum]